MVNFTIYSYVLNDLNICLNKKTILEQFLKFNILWYVSFAKLPSKFQ